jgi:hypothetical protein
MIAWYPMAWWSALRRLHEPPRPSLHGELTRVVSTLQLLCQTDQST